MNNGFTYYTIIGKDLNLLKWHYDNVWNHAGMSKLEIPKEFLVVIYQNQKIPQSTTDSIIQFCQENNISYVLYPEPTPDFLNNLYTCWNLGYQKAAHEWVFRGGSDQAFSKDAFVYLIEARDKIQGEKIVLQANTVECFNRIKQIGANSRHFTLNCGDHYTNYRPDLFDNFTDNINSFTDLDLLDIAESYSTWGHPTELQTSVGNILRCDGCSWLMTKTEFEKYGPLPPLVNGVTGDVLIHDRMMLDGYVQKIVKKCNTYHLVQGESTFEVS